MNHLSIISSTEDAEKHLSIWFKYGVKENWLFKFWGWYLFKIFVISGGSVISNSCFKSANFSEGTKWVAIPASNTSMPLEKIHK